jgi:hypothetical protein
MLEKDDRDFFQPEKLGRFKTTVTADNLTVLIDQNRRIESEGLDAFCYCADLNAAVLARIAGMRPKRRRRKKHKTSDRAESGAFRRSLRGLLRATLIDPGHRRGLFALRQFTRWILGLRLGCGTATPNGRLLEIV